MKVFVARQPIFDNKLNVIGYELLFRQSDIDNVAEIVDGDDASKQTITNSILTIGLDRLSENRQVFINFTKGLIEERVPELLPFQNTIIEILEEVEFTPEVVEIIKELKSKGYKLALDGFVFNGNTTKALEFADYIKVDFQENSEEDVKSIIAKSSSANVKLIAKKVESHEDYRLAKELKFDYYQGYFFCEAEVVEGKELSPGYAVYMRLLREVAQKDMDFAKLEELINYDLGLSYKLMRYINSSYFGHKREVTSVRNALVYMGQREIFRFVSLISVTKLAKGCPPELIRLSMVRGRFCELLSKAAKPGDFEAGELFTLGLFSLLDVILGQHMSNITANMPLALEVREALNRFPGKITNYLLLCEAYEKACWDDVVNLCAEVGVHDQVISDLYIQSCEWATKMALS